MLLLLMMMMMSLLGQVSGCNSSTLMSCLQLDTGAVDLFDRFTNQLELIPLEDAPTASPITRSFPPTTTTRSTPSAGLLA